MDITRFGLKCKFCPFEKAKGQESNMYQHVEYNHSKELKKLKIMQSLEEPEEESIDEPNIGKATFRFQTLPLEGNHLLQENGIF